MEDEPAIFDKAKGYIIRGHELAMGLAIIALILLCGFLVSAIALLSPSSFKVKSASSYQLGYDVGVFCDTDPRTCSVLCVNNLKVEYMVAECTRGMYHGFNAKSDFNDWKNSAGSAGEFLQTRDNPDGQ